MVVNRQKASVSVIRVRNTDGTDASQLLAEVPVGQEPRFVALAPNDSRAYVTNAVDGTMSVIDLTANTPVAIGNAIDVGVEPRGIAITPNGTYAFIAGNTTGDVAVVRLSNNEVVGPRAAPAAILTRSPSATTAIATTTTSACTSRSCSAR